MEGLLKFFVVRFAIRFGLAFSTGFGFCGTGALILVFDTDFSSGNFIPEKIGSKKSFASEGSTIFFLRLAVLSELRQALLTNAYSDLIYIDSRTRY